MAEACSTRRIASSSESLVFQWYKAEPQEEPPVPPPASGGEGGFQLFSAGIGIYKALRVFSFHD